MRKLICIVLAALALACGFYGCSRDNGVSVGNVKTVSEGEEYFPLQNWIFSLNKDGLVIDGERKQPQEVANYLCRLRSFIPALDLF